jgi:chitin disaccharide deacetylase
MRIIKLFPIFVLLGTLNGLAQTRNTTKSIISEEIIFPYQNEHVQGSSIVMLPNGDLLAAWFEGRGERTADDVYIMGTRQKTIKHSVIYPEKMAKETWAEKLGFEKGKKVLLLHMDDAGMCPEANSAVERYIEKGQLSSTAVMMPCPAAKSFVKWAKEFPDADIGVHLTLTSEWQTYRWGPLTNKSRVPGLIDPDGKFWHDVPEVVIHASASEVEKEIRAQIEKMIHFGHKPTHIDTHMGTMYGSLEYVRVFLKVAEEYKIPANVIDLSVPEVAEKFKQAGYPVDDNMINFVGEYHLPKLDNFTSVPEAKTYEEKRNNFFTMVKSLDADLTEIIFHPSVETENLKSITASWQQRVWEGELFSDPVVLQFIKDEGIIITNWKEIMKRFDSHKQN